MKKKLAFKVENELRKKQHESQTIKENQEKAARRKRARLRRERKAQEANNRKGTPRLVKRVDGSDKNSGKSSVQPSSRISEAEEESFLTLSDLNGMISPNLKPFVYFCQEHYDALIKSLKAREMIPWLAIDVKDLRQKLQKKEIEPLYQSFDGLIRLSIKAMGVDSLKKFHCPVCTFARHDFVTQVAEAMQQLIIERV